MIIGQTRSGIEIVLDYDETVASFLAKLGEMATDDRYDYICCILYRRVKLRSLSRAGIAKEIRKLKTLLEAAEQSALGSGFAEVRKELGYPSVLADIEHGRRLTTSVLR